jgi:hypothetical protein
LQNNLLLLGGDFLDFFEGVKFALCHITWLILRSRELLTERNISLILVRFSASERPFLDVMLYPPSKISWPEKAKKCNPNPDQYAFTFEFHFGQKRRWPNYYTRNG